MHSDDLEWAIVGLRQMAERASDLNDRLEAIERRLIIDYDDEDQVGELRILADECRARLDQRERRMKHMIYALEDDFVLHDLLKCADERQELLERIERAEASPRRTVLVRKSAYAGWFVERRWCPTKRSMERQIPKIRKRRYRPGMEELAVPPEPDWEAEQDAGKPKLDYDQNQWPLAGLHRIEREIGELRKRVERVEAIPPQTVVARKAKLGGWLVEGHWRPTRSSMERFIPRAHMLRYSRWTTHEER